MGADMDLYRHFVKSIAHITAGVMRELASGIDSDTPPVTVHIEHLHIHTPVDTVQPEFPKDRHGMRWGKR